MNKHSPLRKAKIGIGPNLNSQTFEYANGTPGDLVIPITPSEGRTWEYIVEAVNAYSSLKQTNGELVEALNDIHDTVKELKGADTKTTFETATMHVFLCARAVLSRAEGGRWV